MKLTKIAAVKMVFVVMCLGMLAVGLGYIWHAIPASKFTGITPPQEFDSLEGWYAYNEITGWCLCFIAAVNLSFFALAGRKVAETSKFIIAMFISLVISIVLAAVVAQILDNYITQ